MIEFNFCLISDIFRNMVNCLSQDHIRTLVFVLGGGFKSTELRSLSQFDLTFGK